jgi:serine/threonine protein kinase
MTAIPVLEAALAPEFEILRPLGDGSTGTVYLARETELRRLVAIKVPHPNLAQDPLVRGRFEREARAAARLRHPAIAAVHRIARLPDGTPYLVMEYIEGRTLDDVLRADGPLPPPDALRFLTRVAEALAEAHDKGVIHRDVRPGNILCTADPECAVLTDFGIAGILETGSEVITRLTRPGERLGDAAYRSPEQLLGDPITPAADIYGWGLVAFEVLTGQRPFVGPTPEVVGALRLRQPPRSLTAVDPEADPRLADLINRCLAREPRHRPTAATVVRKLGRLRPRRPATNPDGTARTGIRIMPGVDQMPALGPFLSELRRRRVFNVALGYAAVAFVLLQGAELILPVLPVHSLAYPLVVAITLAGFPVAMVLAWMYDLTDAGLRRTEASPATGPAYVRWLLPGLGLVLSLLLAVIIGWWVLGGA